MPENYFGFSKARQDLPPVTVSDTERGAFSGEESSALQAAIRGMQGTGKGFVRASDIATSGPSAFGTAMAGVKARGDFRTGQAKRAGMAMTLADSALRGRQQQQLVDVKAAEEERKKEILATGLSASELLANATLEQMNDPAFMSVVGGGIKGSAAKNELLAGQLARHDLGLKNDLAERMDTPENRDAIVEARQHKIQTDRVTNAAAFQEAMKSETIEGLMDGLAVAGVPTPDILPVARQLTGKDKAGARARAKSVMDAHQKYTTSSGLAVASGIDDVDMEAADALYSTMMNDIRETGSVSEETYLMGAELRAKSQKYLREMKEADVTSALEADERKAKMDEARIPETIGPVASAQIQLNKVKDRLTELRLLREDLTPEGGTPPKEIQGALGREVANLTHFLDVLDKALTQESEGDADPKPKPAPKPAVAPKVDKASQPAKTDQPESTRNEVTTPSNEVFTGPPR